MTAVDESKLLNTTATVGFLIGYIIYKLFAVCIKCPIYCLSSLVSAGISMPAEARQSGWLFSLQAKTFQVVSASVCACALPVRAQVCMCA